MVYRGAEAAIDSAEFTDGTIHVGSDVLLEGVKRSEYRGILAWVRSRLAQGDSVETIRGLLSGIGSGAAPDTSVLKGTVKQVRAALETGAQDGVLDALEKAEKAGRKRKGVLAALVARRSES